METSQQNNTCPLMHEDEKVSFATRVVLWYISTDDEYLGYNSLFAVESCLRTMNNYGGVSVEMTVY